jgi:crotonobetainyl-CoA:carnitine CoA-transferase CaiB-like acyl-CoA transferase
MVNNLAQAISHPQVLHRNMVVSIEQSTGENWKFAGNPIKIKGNPETFKSAPDLGENTIEILSGILGYSREYLDELIEKNVIFEPPK